MMQGYSELAGVKQVLAGTERADALNSALQLLFQVSER
jgi:hypothetical protein